MNSRDAWQTVLAEARQGKWWAVYPRGGQVYETMSGADVRPSRIRAVHARDVLLAVSAATCGFGGSWTVAWLSGGRILILVWADDSGEARVVARQRYTGAPKESPQDWARTARDMLATMMVVEIHEGAGNPAPPRIIEEEH